jgi:nuclear GTP-binding protein
LKGGEPCLRSAAIYIIIDFQRGRLPHFVSPPELKEDEQEARATSTAALPGTKGVKQNLAEIDEKKFRKEDEEMAEEDDVVSEDEGSDSGEANNAVAAPVVASGDWD